jgi:hypothetical protein
MRGTIALPLGSASPRTSTTDGSGSAAPSRPAVDVTRGIPQNITNVSDDIQRLKYPQALSWTLTRFGKVRILSFRGDVVVVPPFGRETDGFGSNQPQRARLRDFAPSASNSGALSPIPRAPRNVSLASLIRPRRSRNGPRGRLSGCHSVRSGQAPVGTDRSSRSWRLSVLGQAV